MTQDEIMEMAREASSMARLPWNGEWIFRSKKELMAFVALVAANERGRFALECIDLVALHGGSVEIEAAIRARDQKEGT